jgi:hypothetical protein
VSYLSIYDVTLTDVNVDGQMDIFFGLDYRWFRCWIRISWKFKRGHGGLQWI